MYAYTIHMNLYAHVYMHLYMYTHKHVSKCKNKGHYDMYGEKIKKYGR